MDLQNLDYYLREAGDELHADFAEGEPYVRELDCTKEEEPLIVHEIRTLAEEMLDMSKRTRALYKLIAGDYSGESYLKVLKNIKNDESIEP